MPDLIRHLVGGIAAEVADTSTGLVAPAAHDPALRADTAEVVTAQTRALVAFDDGVQLVSGLTPPDLAGLGPSIAAIGPGGMTNLSGGWLKAIEEVRRRDDGVRRVLLLTDGLANQGVTAPEQLNAVARSTSQQGISTTTIGVGDGFAEELLTGIADLGGGRSWFAESVEDIPAPASRCW